MKLESSLDRFVDWLDAGGWKKLILPVVSGVALLAALISGGFGMVEVQPGQVAVKYTLSGESEVIQQQGLLTYMPFFQKVELLSLEPQVFVMEGDVSGENKAPKLRVRANDGSMFMFPKLETHYQIVPSKADKVISCYGPGNGYTHDILPTTAREVYRNEFGRFSFLEIADPSSYSTATAKAKAAINTRLADCGLEVTQIITPKPDFASKIESAIEDRQNAEQAVEVQATKRERLVAQRDRLVQAVRTEGSSDYQTQLATLKADLEEAKNDATAKRREADKYATFVIECEAKRDSMITLAEANAEAYRKNAEGLAAKISAVGSQGPQVLNLEIAQRVIPQVQKVKARPYSRASQPLDIRTVGSMIKATDGE